MLSPRREPLTGGMLERCSAHTKIPCADPHHCLLSHSCARPGTVHVTTHAIHYMCIILSYFSSYRFISEILLLINVLRYIFLFLVRSPRI